MGEALLTVENLSAWYSDEKVVLSDFSFELAEQEVAGLIGLMIWLYVTDPAEAPPLPLLAALAAIPGVVILGVLLAMMQRIREIQKGEEEDAKEY